MNKSPAFLALTVIVLVAVAAKGDVCIAFGIAFPNSVTAAVANGCMPRRNSEISRDK